MKRGGYNEKIIIWNANMCDKFFYDRLQFR